MPTAGSHWTGVFANKDFVEGFAFQSSAYY
jgi:hypothetical protein